MLPLGTASSTAKDDIVPPLISAKDTGAKVKPSCWGPLGGNSAMSRMVSPPELTAADLNTEPLTGK